jgi:hypothetical protein
VVQSGTLVPAWALAGAALLLAGCVTNEMRATHATFAFNGRDVPITRYSFTTGGGPQVRFYVTSNFVDYPCDGTVENCRRVFDRAETFPRERDDDDAGGFGPPIIIKPR